MAIRIRKIDGITIALCAAKTEAKEGDLYLDDSVHHALSTKFGLDWYGEGLLTEPMDDKKLTDLMEKEGDSLPVEAVVKTANGGNGDDIINSKAAAIVEIFKNAEKDLDERRYMTLEGQIRKMAKDIRDSYKPRWLSPQKCG